MVTSCCCWWQRCVVDYGNTLLLMAAAIEQYDCLSVLSSCVRISFLTIRSRTICELTKSCEFLVVVSHFHFLIRSEVIIWVKVVVVRTASLASPIFHTRLAASSLSARSLSRGSSTSWWYAIHHRYGWRHFPTATSRDIHDVVWGRERPKKRERERGKKSEIKRKEKQGLY